MTVPKPRQSVNRTPVIWNISLRKATRNAFSLIELLVVIAIIGLLSSFAVTGFKNIAMSHGVGQAAADVAGILELARNEAVTRQTYVWAAFREATNGGALEIQMVLAGSKDGSANAAETNLIALSRVVRARNAGLTNFASLQEKTKTLLATNSPVPAELLTNTTGIIYQYSPLGSFSNTTVTFTPRGEVMLAGTPADGFDPMIGIGIVPARGDKKDGSGKDEAGVVLDGSTGSARLLRAN